jgi:hypothetical protein
VAERFRHLAELDHVNSALPSLHFRHKALVAAQASGKLHLSNTGSLAGTDKELNEFLMPLGEDRGWQ